MLLQTNIISAMAGCYYISVFDATGFFYQWLVRLTDRHKFIVMSHRDQKQFNIAVIGFKKITFYVQKKIDVILRIYREFFRVYINDRIIFSHTLNEHISYLHSVFQLFDFYGINLSLKKLPGCRSTKSEIKCFRFHYFK